MGETTHHVERISKIREHKILYRIAMSGGNSVIKIKRKTNEKTQQNKPKL